MEFVTDRAIMMPIAQIVVEERQCELDEAKIDGLKESIVSIGLLNPIVVTRSQDDGSELVRLVVDAITRTPGNLDAEGSGYIHQQDKRQEF